jgi:hypothetical protein
VGGNALKNTHTRRYERDEYYMLELEVILKLRSAFPGRIMETIPAYAGKESFGDMDVLLESDNMTVKVRDVLQQTFAPNEIVKNGNCYSFDYKQLQIDLILTPIEIFHTSLVYFSYNDLGNLMGRIYHQMGLKYGHEGLTYAVYDDEGVETDTRCLGVINVSRKFDPIFAIAGYSFERWLQGFENLEQIFEYAIDTPYFNYGIFDLENRNHRSRIRDRKRPTYTKFLEWAKDKPAKYDWGDMSDFADRKAFLPRINEFFPDFRVKYDAVMEAAREKKFMRELFNGKRVSVLSGFTEQELGRFMSHLKTVSHIEEIAKRTPRTSAVEAAFDQAVHYQIEVFKHQQQEQKEVEQMVDHPEQKRGRK